MSLPRYSTIMLLALAGCQFTPSATNKLVTTNDVVGVWSFPADYGKTTVFMTFTSSGTFLEDVVTGAQTNRYEGTWLLNGPYLDLKGFVARMDGGWKPWPMSWYFIDGDKRRLDLFGDANPDTDSFQHLNYLKAVP